MWSCVLAILVWPSPTLPSIGMPQDDLRARDALIARMQFVVDEARREAALGGLAVVVQSGDGVWWSYGSGWLDAGAQRAATPETAVPAEGLVQPLAALAIGKLVDQGKLAFDDELGKHFAELQGEHGKVTVRQLLAHSSGLPACDAWVDARARAGTATSREDVLVWLAREPADFAPGSCFAYSSSNVLVTGWLVERVAATDFASFVQHEVLGELALTTLEAPKAVPEVADSGNTAGEAQAEPGSLARPIDRLAAANLGASARDLARLVRAAARGQVVSGDTWHELTTPFEFKDGEGLGLALGFDVAPLAGHATVGCGGSAPGAALHTTYYPDFDVALAIVAPGEHGDLDLIERRLARVFLDLAEPDVLDLPLTPEERIPYLGGYYIGCNRVVVGEVDDRLTVALIDREPLVLLYQGAHTFVAERQPELRVVFELADGRAERFVLEERGVRTVAVRMD